MRRPIITFCIFSAFIAISVYAPLPIHIEHPESSHSVEQTGVDTHVQTGSAETQQNEVEKLHSERSENPNNVERIGNGTHEQANAVVPQKMQMEQPHNGNIMPKPKSKKINFKRMVIGGLVGAFIGTTVGATVQQIKHAKSHKCEDVPPNPYSMYPIDI